MKRFIACLASSGVGIISDRYPGKNVIACLLLKFLEEIAIFHQFIERVSCLSQWIAPTATAMQFSGPHTRGGCAYVTCSTGSAHTFSTFVASDVDCARRSSGCMRSCFCWKEFAVLQQGPLHCLEVLSDRFVYTSVLQGIIMVTPLIFLEYFCEILLHVSVLFI